MSPPSAQAIKSYRLSKGWTQAELAKQLGISKRSVEDWEGGRSSPPAYLALAFRALDA